MTEAARGRRRGAAAIAACCVAAFAATSSGCTIGQTRFALGVSLAADAVTTQTALDSSPHARESNPVLSEAPVPIMLVLSGVVALAAEKHVRDGKVGEAKTLYRIASVVHGVAAAWNGYQLGRPGGGGGGATPASASGRRPGIPKAGAGPRSRAAPRLP